jgi:hypothetical protein
MNYGAKQWCIENVDGLQAGQSVGIIDTATHGSALSYRSTKQHNKVDQIE